MIWRQAAGDTNRNYADTCLKWGVILNGPGYTGHWHTGEEKLRNDGWSSKKLTDLRRFAEEMKPGDTTQRLGPGAVFDWVQSIKMTAAKVAPPKLPQVDESQFKLDELSGFLFDQGVASGSIDNLLKEIDELVRIAKWYKKFDNPSESETVAYLVVPLLRALGWTPQEMAIEWKGVDVALFSNLPRSDESLSVVVEAKKKDSSCLSAVSQAQSYAELRPSCHRLIVTDGIRFGACSYLSGMAC